MHGDSGEAQFFPAAPVGGRARLVPYFVCGVFVAAFAFNAWLATHLHYAGARWWWVALAPAAGLPIAIGGFILSELRGYRVTGEELLVLRAGRDTRIPLAGLEAIQSGRHWLQDARKLWRGDGMWVKTYRNERLGKFSAYLTDVNKAVILRWPDRCVVVSPDQIDAFVETINAVRRRSRR